MKSKWYYIHFLRSGTTLCQSFANDVTELIICITELNEISTCSPAIWIFPSIVHKLLPYMPQMNFELIPPLCLFLCRLKRKVQNFFPCKTPTRGGHLDHNGLPHSGQLAATYEDPDAHMGHSPLVLGHPQFQHRNHRNLEVSKHKYPPTHTWIQLLAEFHYLYPTDRPFTSSFPSDCSALWFSGFEFDPMLRRGWPWQPYIWHYSLVRPSQDVEARIIILEGGSEYRLLFIQIKLHAKNGESRANLSKYWNANCHNMLGRQLPCISRWTIPSSVLALYLCTHLLAASEDVIHM